MFGVHQRSEGKLQFSLRIAHTFDDMRIHQSRYGLLVPLLRGTQTPRQDRSGQFARPCCSPSEIMFQRMDNTQ